MLAYSRKKHARLEVAAASVKEKEDSMSKEETPEWKVLDLPSNSCTMPGPIQLHYLELDEDWKIYVYDRGEPNAAFMGARRFPGVVQSGADWSVAYKRQEIAGGRLGSVESARKIALRCVMAFQDVDPELPQEHSCFPGGFPDGSGALGGGH